jgi:hypothetical protein
MLEKLCKTVLIFSFLLNYSTAVANNFTHQNVDKAHDVFDKMVSYHGGEEAIIALDKVLVDYDHSINYRTQGFGYEGLDYHSNRPGNTLSLISFKDEINWWQFQYKYMNSFHSTTSLHQNGFTHNYNDITQTFTKKSNDDFDKKIERQALRNPLLLIKSALKQQDSLRYLGEKIVDKKLYHLIALKLTSGTILTTYIDQSNYQMAKVEYLQKDLLIEYLYSDYQRVGEFNVPFFIKRNLPEYYYSSYFYYQVASYNFDANVDQIAIIPKDYVLAQKKNTYDGKLRMQTIGKGLYWLTRNGANTIFVEFSDYVMAVDAFGFGLDERIENFRELVPNKPIKYVSVSHHHHDHMEQVSFHANQGTTIITAKEFIPLLNKRINDVYPNKHVKPVFDIVTKKREYADETQRVEIYELKNMLHAETMLMTYFPAEQLIYLPDHYEDMYLIENNQPIRLLLAEIERLGLKVKGFIQAHGNEIFSLEKVKAAVAHPIKMKDFRRQPHQSVTHTE